MMNVDWEKYDIFFLFNPFQEHKLRSNTFAIDRDINFDDGLYKKYAKFVEDRIKKLPAGRRLITLDGFGGRVPKNWRVVSSNRLKDGRLNHWIKVR